MQKYLTQLEARQDLTMDDMSAALDRIMAGGCADGQIERFLLALCQKGETVDEIAGAAAAMRRHMAPIRIRRQGVVDTCGTGGDASGTFNISTAAALVAAAAGAAVAKHGNRRVTSTSGSADVLLELGVNIDADNECVGACLEQLGIGFFFAPRWHSSMKHVAAVRQKLGVPTIFNLLGPLTNPAGAPFQLLGVGRAELRPRLAAALARLGTERALVVRGDDGLDEVTIATTTRVTLVEGERTSEFTWTPDDFGLATGDLATLKVSGPGESAAVIRKILDGTTWPARDITVINAAAALWVSGKAPTATECARLAEAAIDSGQARELLAKLVEQTRQPRVR